MITTKLHLGDCLEVMRDMDENSVDTIITDSPYELAFMGKAWDASGISFQKETWEACLRVAKPGAIILAFGGTRTYHRLVCAIEDAGWIIRDTIGWVYSTGFPKSHNVSKQLDKMAGAERQVIGKSNINIYQQGKNHKFYSEETGNPKYQKGNITAPSTPEAQLWEGWGTALKPAMELICVAMKPIDGSFAQNALKWGVAGLNIDGGRVNGINEKDKNNFHQNRKIIKEYKADETLYRLGMKTVSTTEHSQGRFPANLIHDGSDDVVRLFPQSKTNHIEKPVICDEKANTWGGTFQRNRGARGYDEDGSAARFFYSAKASKSERNAGLEGMEEKFAPKGNNEGRDMDNPKNHLGGMQGSYMQNHHPTVKPLALMEYLVRLTKTPTGGVVLDPFAGSGTTGIACAKQGRDFIGIEIDPDYYKIAEVRINHAKQQMRLGI